MVFWGASGFSDSLAPRASGCHSPMSRPGHGIHYTKDMHANHEREHHVRGQKRLPSVKWQSVAFKVRYHPKI